MKSEGKKEKENHKERASDHPAGFAEDATIRPLHDCACCFISLAHSWLERITHFPFPMGTIFAWAEDLVDRWTRPLAQALQCHSLSILASIDDQIFCLVEGCGLCSKVQLKVVLSQLYTQGLVGTSAGLWIKYEGAVKEDIRKAVSLAERVPLINLVTPIFISLITPSARVLSDWLLKQGERRVHKSPGTVESCSIYILKQVASDGHDAVVTKSVQLEGPVFKSDGGDVQYEGQNVSSVHDGSVGDVANDDLSHGKEDTTVECSEERRQRVDDVVKEDVLHAKEDSNVDVVKDDVLLAMKDTKVDEMCMEQMDASAEGIVEDDLNVGKAVPAIEKKGLSHAAKEGDDYLPDVLEMLESSWLLGTSAFPKRASTLSQKKHTSSAGFASRRAFLNG